MKLVDVKMVSSPTQQRLIINGNVVNESDIIPYDVLFELIGKETKETCQVTFHYEWTADLDEYDGETGNLLLLKPGEGIVVGLNDDEVELDTEADEIIERLEENDS